MHGWGEELQKCFILHLAMGQDCENLPNPENGRVVLNGNNPGSTATYSCDTRYRLVGSEERTCQNDGEWSESAPTCECKHVLVHFNYDTVIMHI